MELVLLVAVWSLAFGNISLGSAKLKGHRARTLGVALILVAAYGLPHVNSFFGAYLPKLVSGNEALRATWDLLIGAGAIYVTNFLVGAIYPKLSLPSVNVSIKHHKRAA